MIAPGDVRFNLAGRPRVHPQKAHRADGEVIIQVLSGRLEVTLEAGMQIVARGALLTISAGETHSVRATDASEMLLTICHRPAT